VRTDLARARDRAAVRAAARDWERAGVIPAPARAAIDARWSDDRVSRSKVLRVLIFVFVWIIVSSTMGIAFATLRPSSEDAMGVLLLVFAVALAAATEYFQGPRRFDGTGAEAATSFLAASTAVGGIMVLFFRRAPEETFGTILLIMGIVWAAAWLRWGFPVYALFASVALLFGGGMIVGEPRLVWLVVGALAAIVAERRRARGGANAAGGGMIEAAALAAVYAAVNLWSLDRGAIEYLRPGASPAAPHFPEIRFAAAAATAVVPAAVLAAGLVLRRRLAIDAGLAMSALSLVTLRVYVRLGPLWLVLAEAGAAAMATAFLAERWLDSGAARERAGLTADPFFEDAATVRAASAAAAVLALSPSASAPAPSELRPGGGSYGGGGATGDF
jgi:hypothetical protein